MRTARPRKRAAMRRRRRDRVRRVQRASPISGSSSSQKTSAARVRAKKATIRRYRAAKHDDAIVAVVSSQDTDAGRGGGALTPGEPTAALSIALVCGGRFSSECSRRVRPRALGLIARAGRPCEPTRRDAGRARAISASLVHSRASGRPDASTRRNSGPPRGIARGGRECDPDGSIEYPCA